eukprot:Nitzschia sp. Nitz4//scaffold11_size288233//119025//120468//NITZ4_000768-RA/size288233-processed-gene-0.218-mRNA-1//-1//CDS//3329534056//6853//frame0
MKLVQFVLSSVAAALLLGTSQAVTCYDDIENIYLQESYVSDTSRRRTYVLCPSTVFQVDKLDFNYDVQTGTMNPPLPIRPNMTIQCGDDGSRENTCVLSGGDVHVDATTFRGIGDATVDGAIIMGLTFVDVIQYSTWATKPGHLSFQDCEWRDHTRAVAPIMMDYYDGTSEKLTITFDQCTFKDNVYPGFGSHTSLIYSNGPQNAVEISRTVFQNNDMTHNNTLSATNSFLVETLGPLDISRSCFVDNAVGVSNTVVFGSTFANDNNYMMNSTGAKCEFGATFETLQQFDDFDPICAAATSDMCLSEETASPTTSPPSSMPSESPSAAPSDMPSVSPSVSPTNSPTMTPAPTTSTKPPTESPTVAPSLAPSLAPDFTFPSGAVHTSVATALMAVMGVVMLA